LATVTVIVIGDPVYYEGETNLDKDANEYEGVITRTEFAAWAGPELTCYY